MPPRICSSAVITITAPVSAMRSRRLCAEKPPKTTECVAPMRAQAEHRDHALDRHRHVDDDPVALDHAARLERVGEPAGALEQLAVADLGDRAVVGLEDDRGLVAEPVLDVAVEAVVRGVQRAVLEPLEERRLVVVEDALERRSPRDQLARQAPPVALVVARGLVAEGLVGGHPRDPGVLHGLGGRRVDVLLCAHSLAPAVESGVFTSCAAPPICAAAIATTGHRDPPPAGPDPTDLFSIPGPRSLVRFRKLDRRIVSRPP